MANLIHVPDSLSYHMVFQPFCLPSESQLHLPNYMLARLYCCRQLCGCWLLAACTSLISRNQACSSCPSSPISIPFCSLFVIGKLEWYCIYYDMRSLLFVCLEIGNRNLVWLHILFVLCNSVSYI